MHTYASNRYYELRIKSHTQQNWCTMMLVKELRERYPNAGKHAAMTAKAIDHMECAMIRRKWFMAWAVCILLENI